MRGAQSHSHSLEGSEFRSRGGVAPAFRHRATRPDDPIRPPFRSPASDDGDELHAARLPELDLVGVRRGRRGDEPDPLGQRRARLDVALREDAAPGTRQNRLACDAEPQRAKINVGHVGLIAARSRRV